MKNVKKEHMKKEKKEKNQLMRTWGEVLYNCPYLIAVVVTSLIIVANSDEIGIKAIASETVKIPRQTAEMGTIAEGMPADIAVETAQLTRGKIENEEEIDLGKMENAGERKDEDAKIDKNQELENDSENIENTENTEEIIKGITEFEFYEPQEIDSYYYSDAGKIALTTEYPYTKENTSYFNDALFLGDSRTLGISDYAGLDEADFYCDSGMMIFKLLKPAGVTNQKTRKKEDLTQVLQQKQYGKIYIMLGMNELGYGNTKMYMEKYSEVVEQIREWQPDAIIYIMANLHVSKEKNNLETEFNNININDKNAASALLANGTDIFYLDVNPLFTDSEGFLKSELSFDGVHLYAKHYDVWREFLLEHAVEPKHTVQNTSTYDVDSTVDQVPDSTDSVASQASMIRNHKESSYGGDAAK